MLARAGLLAGGVGVVLLHGSERALGQTFNETTQIVPPPGDQALTLKPSGSVPPSTSVGGALNLDNTASTGAGVVLYSNRGADAAGRLLAVNQDNPANPQHAVRVENAGVGHTVSIFHDPAGGAGNSNAEAIAVESTNVLDTTVGVRGREQGKGTVKVTHEKPAGSDAGASALSIALLGSGTACQGIFIGNDAGNPTTGPLLNIRNGGAGTERLVLNADGRMELPVQGALGGLLIGSDAKLYRTAAGVLTTPGGLEARTVIVHNSMTLAARTSNPPPPLTGAVHIYVKDGKLVIQWNDGQKALYTTIGLNNPGPYPAPALVTTDTSPP